MECYIINISVAKPYGRFGQKLEILQAGQGDRAKAEHCVGKSRAGHDGYMHGAI